jgi:5-methylcytosine-specific restriction endonuclease McrA
MPSLDWREIAAARMTRFLARKPRHRKTRAYLQTLPKRAPITVRPEDYQLSISRSDARLSAVAKLIRDVQRYAEWVARGKPTSSSIPRKDRRRPRAAHKAEPLRVRLHLAQAGACGLCGGRLERGRGTLDHVVPRARGGGNIGNLLLAHGRCNHAKADRMPTQMELDMLAAVNAVLARDSDGTATAAANGDLPVPQDCQARAEGIAPDIHP